MPIRKILIVDDSATDRLYLSEMLEKGGFNVIHAQSGEQGLALAESEMPDLIVMDIIMPGITGFQATRALTRSPVTAHIPVIVCTGKSQATDQAWALKMGARSCLAKPVVEVDLMSQIETLG